MDLVLNHYKVPPIASGENNEWGKDIKSLILNFQMLLVNYHGLMAYSNLALILMKQ